VCEVRKPPAPQLATARHSTVGVTHQRQSQTITAGLDRGVGQMVGLNSGVHESESRFFSLPVHTSAISLHPLRRTLALSLPPFSGRQTLPLPLFFSFFFFPILQPFYLVISSTSLGTEQTCVYKYYVWVWVCGCEENSVTFFTLTSACTRYRVIAHRSNPKSSRPTEEQEVKEGIKNKGKRKKSHR